MTLSDFVRSLGPAVSGSVKNDGALCDQFIGERFELRVELLVIRSAENQEMFGAIVQDVLSA